MDKLFERLNQNIINSYSTNISYAIAFIAQSGERQTEDLVVAGSIPAEGTVFNTFLKIKPIVGAILFLNVRILRLLVIRWNNGPDYFSPVSYF